MSKKINKKPMPKSRKLPKTAHAAAGVVSPFLGALRLRFIRLVDCEARIVISNGMLPTEIKIELRAGRATRQEGDQHIVGVHVTVTVEGVAPGTSHDDPDASKLLIASHFECQYISAALPSEEDLKNLDGMGVMATWPSVRDFVLSTSTRMGMPPTLLPLVTLDQATKQLVFLGSATVSR